MTKIDIFSGFLGAGKTTLIKKLIKEAYAGEKVVLIENEFGEIGIDGGFLADAGIEITEMNSGCICCSLVGDFSKALVKVLEEYTPDRVIIEPSGVGKLSDVIRAAKTAEEHGVLLHDRLSPAQALGGKNTLEVTQGDQAVPGGQSHRAAGHGRQHTGRRQQTHYRFSHSSSSSSPACSRWEIM